MRNLEISSRDIHYPQEKCKYKEIPTNTKVPTPSQLGYKYWQRK